MNKLFKNIIFLYLIIGLVYPKCDDGQVLINGKCTQNDVKVPEGAITATHGSKKITLQFAQTQNDSTSLDFLITVTTVDKFFLVFGETYINSDAAMFNVQNNSDGLVVSVIDSYYQEAFPSLPKSDSEIGGEQNIDLLGYSLDNTDPKNPKLLTKIRRKYNTNDKYDTPFSADQIQLQRCLFGIPKQAGGDDWYRGSFFFILNSQTKPCTGGQIFDGKQCVNNDLTNPSKLNVAKYHADDFLSIYYDTNQDKTITILLSAKTKGYFGVGWGSNLMSNMDMTIVNVNHDNPNFPIVIVDDSYSLNTQDPLTQVANGSPIYDTMVGGTYDLKILGYKVTDTELQVKFTRSMENNDKLHDFQFDYNQEIPYAFAFSPSDNFSLTLAYHKHSVGWGTMILQATDAQSCSKNNKVFINNQCVTNDVSAVSLTESKIIDSSNQNGFISLQYAVTDGEMLTMLFTIQNVGWFGFGFGPGSQPGEQEGDAMQHADIIIFNTVTLEDESLAIVIQDTFAQKNVVPNPDVSIGGTDDLQLLGYTIDKQKQITTVKVQRKLNTGDKFDYQFKKNSQVAVMYAWQSGINNIQFHGNNAGQDILDFYHDAQKCPDGQVSIDNICKPNDITPLTSSASDSFLDIQFTIDKDTIKMMFVIQNTGWFGLGFGKNMNNVDMIVVTNNSGIVSISDNYSTQTSSPPADTKFPGGENNLTLLGYQISKKTTTVKFSRKLNTGDKYDAILVPDESLTIVYAWGSQSQMSFHGNNYAGAAFPLKEGYKGTLTGLEFNDNSKTFHFWSNFVLWGFVVDIGFLTARFFKTGRYYKEIHGSIMGIIVAFTAFVEIWIVIQHDMLFNGQLSSQDNTMKVHAIMGFIFLIFFILEAIGGIFLNYLLSFKKTGDASSLKIKSFHKYFGYLLYALGKTNVFLGVRVIENETQQTACIAGYSIFIALRFIMEYLYRKQPKIFSQILFLTEKDAINESSASSHSLISAKEGYSDLVDMINSKKTSEQIKQAYPKSQFVLYKDYIYTLDKMSHPGGQFIFNAVNGRDIGRFILGAYGLESTNMPAHTHTSYAMQLLKQQQIGIYNQVNIMSEQSSNSHLWTISKEKQLSKTTALFYLKSQNRIKVNNQQQGMEWIGRHFTLSDLNNEKSTRIYTNCLSFTPYNINLFEKMTSNYKQLLENPNATIDNSIPQQTHVLPLVIKRYESATGFSQYVHDYNGDQNQQELEIKVEGPHGRGLELSDKSEGLHLFVSGGTGILPFYDLLVYYSKYLMYKALEKKHGEKVAKSFDIINDNFKKSINESFKIKVIAAFNAPDDDNGALQLLELLKKIDQDNNLNLFDAVVSVKGYQSENLTVDSEYFTQQYFEKHIGNSLIKRAFVCGPPGLNKNVPIALEEMGLNPDQVQLI